MTSNAEREIVDRMWVIYPPPEHHSLVGALAREWVTYADDDVPVPSEQTLTADTVEAVRQLLPGGFVRYEPADQDTTSVEEVWISR